MKINIQTYQKDGLLEPMEEPFNLGTKIDGLFRPPFEILRPKVLYKILSDIGNQKMLVLRYLLEHKDALNYVEISQRELAKEIGMSPQTVNSTIKRLKDDEVLIKSGTGYRISPKLIVKGNKLKTAYIWDCFRADLSGANGCYEKKHDPNDWYVQINAASYLVNNIITPIGEPINVGAEMKKKIRGGFEIINLKSLCTVLSVLGNSKLLVLKYLLEHKDGMNCINISQEEIARELQLSPQTVNSTFKYLIEEKLLARNHCVYRISSRLIVKGTRKKEGYISEEFQAEYENMKRLQTKKAQNEKRTGKNGDDTRK